MLKRYPHTGTIQISKETDNGTSTPDISNVKIEIKGRYEPAGQNKAMDYSAKFYCKNISRIKQTFVELGFFLVGFTDNETTEAKLKPFEIDGKTFVFNGKQLKIVQLFPYQTHCEIWLE